MCETKLKTDQVWLIGNNTFLETVATKIDEGTLPFTFPPRNAQKSVDDTTRL